jgi:uncharacterized protein (DUF1800 family)
LRIESVIAANRFGLGARPGELSRIDANPWGWLLDQLQGPPRLPDDVRSLPDSASVYVEVQELRDKQRMSKEAAESDQPVRDFGPDIRALMRKHYLSQTNARFRSATQTDYPFHERLVHFWSNHFAVSADKPPVSALAGLFEHEAIRPNLGGKFYDLLVAAEKHPVMIVYLDNQRSIGPNSMLGLRANARDGDQQVGLNENLAREILELHTLGVDGGYTQEDVTTFARVITGWSIGGAGYRGRRPDGEPGTFHFRHYLHEPGKRRILHQTYKEGGVEQGEAVLRDLATHASTARHVATKLVRHFVSDHPPERLVRKIASIFLDSGGDLPAVHSALVNSREAWRSSVAKYKTPEDLVMSTFRAFDRVPDESRLVVGALDMMGQSPYQPGSPAGWPDTAEHWGGADALYKRIEWSNAVARYAGSGIDPVELGSAALGPALGDHTRTAISRAESVIQGTTLLLASPEFQRR